MTANSTLPASADAAKPRLILVDGSGYIFRANHALPPLTRPDGVAVGAVYGFTNMMLKLREQFKNDAMAVVFDASRISFRQDVYADYKANRSETPEDLIPQFPLVRDATRALCIPQIEIAGVEADDTIASYAKFGAAHGYDVIIVSSDKDLMQLITDHVQMYDPMKNKFIGEAEVMEKFGVPPNKVIEVQALIGDSVDNVPGVPGIGPKTAAELINQFGTLEGVLASTDQIKQPKRRESLIEHAANARMSYQLVQLKDDVALPTPIEDLKPCPYDVPTLAAFLAAQNFNSLYKKITGGAAISAPPLPPASKPMSAGVAAVAERPAQTTQSVAYERYETITTLDALTKLIAKANARGLLCIDTETTGLDAHNAKLVGIALAVGEGEAAYIPLQHVSEGSLDDVAAPTHDLFATNTGPKLVEGQLTLAQVQAALKPVLSDAGVLKIGHNIKYDIIILKRHGFTLSPIADTMLMSYVTSAGLRTQGLDALVLEHFGHRMIPFSEVCGTGKNQKNFSQITLADATRYAAEDADMTLRLYHLLKTHMIQQHVVRVYEIIERPLIDVIVAMEEAGIAINVPLLKEISAELEARMQVLEADVMREAGMQFLISSPKQLGEVLFDKMQLPGGKKSAKTGAYTTDAETLETLAEQGVAIAEKVLEWRQFAKLKNTYTDTLPEAISPHSNRVHTSYAMAIASTGRLSSSEPNLQNIPIRTKEGKRIREAFVAMPGNVLISADYSQIELRLLAHVAGIDVLQNAFKNGDDIHAITASQMFGVPVNEVSGELRRQAKTINFGIIYGISAHGLSQRLGISRSDAANYIERYFTQYPGIREYMDSTIAFARAHGYVETLFGRRVYVRDINAKNPNLRNFSERAAINAPLQGTAADIIKLAMIGVHERLPAWKGAKLLLQVHDELVIECAESDAQAIAAAVQRTMQGVAQLCVPLTVEVGVGPHWGAIH